MADEAPGFERGDTVWILRRGIVNDLKAEYVSRSFEGVIVILGGDNEKRIYALFPWSAIDSVRKLL